MKKTDKYLASLTDDGRYRLLVEGVTDYAIYMLDATGIVSSWNAGAQRFKGYKPSEIIGHHFSRFYTEEDQKAGLPARALETAAREGRFEAEGWRVRNDGTRFWAHVVIDPIRNPAGLIVGYSKITRDLSERKAAETELLRSAAEFKMLVQAVTDYAIYMLDLNGRITNWNSGAERIKGYTADEIVGEHFSRFYTPEDQAKGMPQNALDTAVREGRFEAEAWRVRKDGTRFWANVVIDPIRGDNGAILGFAKITRDISERKKSQESLELARNALVQSQKMEAIGQLTGGIAHDFNNLLMAIQGSLELVRKRVPDTPRITSLLDNAIQGVVRGTTLTKRLLAFARRQELTPEDVDIAGLVRGMTNLLERSLGPLITIETHFPLSLARVKVDVNQLEMALLNLCVNARDAMPNGGTIDISAREERAPEATSDKFISLTVTDSGEGMDEETLARAIEPFFTTKGVGKGTGLGLPMVHGLAEQSGGRFTLKSQKGKGTTAEILLPAAPPKTAVASEAMPLAQEIEKSVPPLVVLAVDDDALVLLNTLAMLEELGHTAVAAYSASEALDIVRSEKSIDLVITDQAMPHMTGVQLAEAIRQERPDLAIILATGYAELPPGAGATMPRLSKPFSLKDLAGAISKQNLKGQEAARVVKFRGGNRPAG